MSYKLWFGSAIIAAILGGCVDDQPLREPMERRQEAPLPAVEHLLQRAEAHLQTSDDLMQAEADAERAYRLRPQDPRVLLLMARIAQAQRAPADAEQWALQALDRLATDAPLQQAAVWDLIAELRTSQGDTAGALQARDTARQLRRGSP